MFFSSCSSLVSEFCFALSVCTSEHLTVKNFISIEGFEKTVAFCQNTLNHTQFFFFFFCLKLIYPKYTQEYTGQQAASAHHESFNLELRGEGSTAE